MTAVPIPHEEVRPAGRVSIAVTSPAALVRVTGDIDLALLGTLRGTLDDAVALRPYVIVDLTAAGAIASAGFGTLGRARTTARRGGGDLLLVSPAPVLRTAVGSGRPHTAFRTFRTVPQAITAVLTSDR